jgi:hypothetical protein
LSALIAGALSRFAARTADLRRRCASGDVAGLTKDPIKRELAAADRSAGYVWLAAALERYINEFCASLLQELNSLAIPRKKLKLSLFALLDSPTFDSLQQIRGQRMWNTRAELMAKVDDVGAATFSLDQMPLDGGTIEARHFETIWGVFGLTGSSYPSPRHMYALKDLSNLRNDLAHGDADPVKVGRQRTALDLLKTLEVVEDVAEHLALRGDDYVSRALYHR